MLRTCNLDSVAQRRHRAVCPARAAVLRDVLVARHSAVVDTVLVAPVQHVGDILRLNVPCKRRQRRGGEQEQSDRGRKEGKKEGTLVTKCVQNVQCD